MSMISYAQNAEDVLLNRLFVGREDGFYIDVGAHDPASDSVTKHFYDRGWHGINIEPRPVCDRLKAERPRDVNLRIAASDAAGTATFFHVNEAPCWSTLDPRAADEIVKNHGFSVSEESLPVRTLKDVCDEFVRGPIDFLKIDVEGAEGNVIRGADWAKYRPTVLVVEALVPGIEGSTHGDWEPILLAADYLFAFNDGLNRYYLRREDEHLVPKLSYPAGVLDNFVRADVFAMRNEWARLKSTVEWQLSRERELVAAVERFIGRERELVGTVQRFVDRERELVSTVERFVARERELSTEEARLRSRVCELSTALVRQIRWADDLSVECEEQQKIVDAVRLATSPSGLTAFHAIHRVASRFPRAKQLAKRILKRAA